MSSAQQPSRTERAILAALARNRGELDAAALERLLARLNAVALRAARPA